MQEPTELMLDLQRRDLRAQVERERLVRALAARQRLLRRHERVRQSLDRIASALARASR